MKFKPNKKTLNVIGRFSELIEVIADKFYWVTMGGIAVDAYAGRLTRDHPDVDILVFRNDLERAENAFKGLGYPYQEFTHPKDNSLVYKVQTDDPDRTFSFQIMDKKGDEEFEVSFYRDLRLVFPISYIKPVTWLNLEGVRFPAVSKEFLIKLKQNEIKNFKKFKPKKRLNKYLNCLKDIKLL